MNVPKTHFPVSILKTCHVLVILLVNLAIIGCSDDRSSKLSDNMSNKWSSPEILANGNVNQPSIAAGADGELYAAWSDADSGAPFVVAQFMPGSGWQTPESIGELISDKPEFEYKIAANDSGDIINVWVQYDGEAGISTVLSKRYIPGSGWQGTVPLDTGNSATSPTVVLDNNGNAVVAWKRLSSPYSLMTSHSGIDESFTTPVNHANGVREFQLVLDSTGAAVVIFSKKTEDSILVTSATRSALFGIWTDVEDIGFARPDNGFFCSPIPCLLGDWNLNVGTNGEGEIAATWEAFDPDTSTIHVWVNTYHQTTGWGLPESIAEAEQFSTLATIPKIMIDDEANLVLLWRSVQPFDGAPLELWMRRYSSITGWQSSTKEELFTNKLNYSDSPITPTLSGGFFMTWFKQGAYVTEWSPLTGWSDIQALSHTEENVYSTSQIVVDKDGVATLIWYERNSNEDDSPFTIRVSQSK